MPPSSSTAGLSWEAAAWATILPERVEPVNTIMSDSETARAPTSPSPTATAKSPSGKRPVAWIAASSHRAVLDVHSEGLSSTAFPASNAAKASPIGIKKGMFQGVMRPTTPRGT